MLAPHRDDPPDRLEDLAARLPAKARLIGVDLGTKTIGLALSDVERRIASPLVDAAAHGVRRRTPRRCSAQIRRVRGLRADRSACRSISTARDGPRAQSTRAFARNFAAPRPICRSPFGTSAFPPRRSMRALIANDVSRARRAEVVDKMAAAYILQGALDRLAASRWRPMSPAH